MAFTQLTAFGACVCPRYGSFAGKNKATPSFQAPKPIQLPQPAIDQLKLQRMDEEEILLIIAAQIASHSIH